MTDNKIVLSRPPVWEFEKTKITDDNTNIIVTLEGSKKEKSYET